MHLQSEGITNFNAILTANNTFCNKRPYSSLCHTVQCPVTITFFFLPSYHSPNEIRKAASGTHSFARTPHWCQELGSSSGNRDYRLRAKQSSNRGSIPNGGKIFLCLLRSAHTDYGTQPASLFTAYRRIVPWRSSGQSVKLTTHPM
jgi:hypothetical protein